MAQSPKGTGPLLQAFREGPVALPSLVCLITWTEAAKTRSSAYKVKHRLVPRVSGGLAPVFSQTLLETDPKGTSEHRPRTVPWECPSPEHLC